MTNAKAMTSTLVGTIGAAMGAGLLLLAQSAVDLKSEESCEFRVCSIQQMCGRMLSMCPGLEHFSDVLSTQQCREVEPLSMSSLLADMRINLPSVSAGPPAIELTTPAFEAHLETFEADELDTELREED